MEQELRDYIDEVLGVCTSRARFVINYILEHGAIDSEIIRIEGYVHGARAVGDVRDNGIPLNTQNVKSSDGKTIARYTFGLAQDIKRHKFGGRVNFPKSLKGQLLNRDGAYCAVSKMALPEDELTIDHRVPYYISGDINGVRNPADFMLLSKSMQRSKSWDCEHCPNITSLFDMDTCSTCYWAHPDNYTHVAMKRMRRINITWVEDEVDQFERLEADSRSQNLSIQDYLKRIASE
ncbi:hypothetical protein [Photobacterium leiognathi]|uniref:hypothetical protein n=1 Tax=Photobacterium leiognathi TaxID=553611 RepID=UPI0029812C4C|nr:hypothetical protein [Photobacterium leiognathi]